MTLTIRARLTLWYTALLGAILVAFSAGILMFQARWSQQVLDEELAGVASTVAEVFKSALAASHDVRRAAADTRRSVNLPGHTTAILGPGGDPLSAHWRGFRFAEFQSGAGVKNGAATITQHNTAWRVRIVSEDSTSGRFLVLVAAPETARANAQRLLTRLLVATTPLALTLAAMFSWWTSARALRPLTTMAAQAERLTARSPDARLTEAGADDEVHQLARAFNGLLQRLGTALRAQRQFMANASHELRTPVSVAQTAAEVTLSRDRRDESEYRDALEVVDTQTRRLGRMVDDMLVLARADAGGYPMEARAVCLSDLAEECVRAACVLAAARGIECAATIEPAITIAGDPALLRQLVMNVAENAIKHTPPGGSVTLALRRQAHDAILAIHDTGPGVPAAERERVFERFVRLDQTRDTRAGAGLGLPIARWIAEAHAGSLEVEDSDGPGATFIARLPLRVVPRRSTHAPAA